MGSSGGVCVRVVGHTPLGREEKKRRMPQEEKGDEKEKNEEKEKRIKKIKPRKRRKRRNQKTARGLVGCWFDHRI